jgi:hypothetical protein
MSTLHETHPADANDNTGAEALLGDPENRREVISRPRSKDGRAGTYIVALLSAGGLSAAVLYFTGLVQCWMFLGGADPAAWWNGAIESQDLSPDPGPAGLNCTACISAAPLAFQGCPFGAIGFYVLAGFAAAVPNFILCAALVALCAARSKIANARRQPPRRIRSTLSTPGNAQ